MVKKISMLFLGMALFWACAIHKDFPYICFRPGCVAKQFGLPDIREVKAKQKSRNKARQSKRRRNRTKKENGKDNYPSYDDTVEELVKRKDSLKYTFSSTDEDQYIVIKFLKKGVRQTDSILIKYPEKDGELLEYDKQLLKSYIDSNGIEKIDLIQVKEHSGSKESDEYYEKHLSPVKKKLEELFIQLGIPSEKIRLKKDK